MSLCLEVLVSGEGLLVDADGAPRLFPTWAVPTVGDLVLVRDPADPARSYTYRVDDVEWPLDLVGRIRLVVLPSGERLVVLPSGERR